MGLEDELKRIEWQRLMGEWKSFEPDKVFKKLDPVPFTKALIHPIPRFVELFLSARKDRDKDLAARNLYAFLLDKRYFERLNLLHFAFHIFEEQSPLPKEIIARTPFPHEESIPNFRYSLSSRSILVDYNILGHE